jgi:hypothetical protein
MRVTVQNKEGTDTDDFYVVFTYLGRERRALINRKVMEYHNVDDIPVGSEIEVLKSIRNGKEFFIIRKIYDAKNGGLP